MRTYTSEYIGDNVSLDRPQYRIYIWDMYGDPVGFVEIETECGDMGVLMEDGGVTESDIKYIRDSKVWRE